jgi:O-methyltransferase involved in polyketide biosynthesis
LPPDAADLFLDRITALSAPGSTLVLDHGEDSPLFRVARATISPELVDMWQGGPTEDLNTWFTERGWQATTEDIAPVAARYGRHAPPAFDPERADSGRGWLITAHLKEDRP